MAEKKDAVTFISLRNEVNNKKFRPIYVLNGDEPYYIDKLSELIVEQALDEDERDFNLNVFYGNDALVADVINTCRQFPAFAQRRVVVLREAQLVTKQLGGHKNDLDLFARYAEKPLSSTILVICHKDGALKSKPFLDALKKENTGVVLQSSKARKDSDLAPLVTNYAASLGCTIDAKSVSMMCDHIGNDIARMYGELDKLSILVGDKKAITPDIIERNIGISKDYNNFELEDALFRKNSVKVYRIVDYFKKTQKSSTAIFTVALLFSSFSKLLLFNTCKDRSMSALMSATGMKSTYQLKKYEEAARYYNTRACVNVIRYLRECDVKSKGIGSRQDAFELLTELMYKILHAR